MKYIGADGGGGVVHVETDEYRACLTKVENYLNSICQIGITTVENIDTVNKKLPETIDKLELKHEYKIEIKTDKIAQPIEGLVDFKNSYATFSAEVVDKLFDIGEAASTVDPENASVFEEFLIFMNTYNAAWIVAALGQYGVDYMTNGLGSNSAYSALYKRIYGIIEKGANSAGYYADGRVGDGFYRNGNWAEKIYRLLTDCLNDDPKLVNFKAIGVGTAGSAAITAIIYMYSDYIKDGTLNDLLGATIQGATAAACYFTWGAITGTCAAIGGPMILVGTLVAIGATWVISTVGSEVKKYFTGNYEIGKTGIYKNGTGDETWDYYTKKYRHDDFIWDMFTGNEPDRWYVESEVGVTPKTYKNLMYSDWRNVVDESEYEVIKDDLDSIYEKIKNAGSYEEAKRIYDEACKNDSVLRMVLENDLPFDITEYYYYTHQKEYANSLKEAQAEAENQAKINADNEAASKKALEIYNTDLSKFDETLDTFLEEESSFGNMGIDAFESNVKKVNQLASTINSNEHYSYDHGILTFEQFLENGGFGSDYRKLYEENPVHAEYLFRKYCEAMEENVENTQVEIA